MIDFSRFLAATLSGLLADPDRQDFVLLETTKISPENHRSLLFVKPVSRLTLTAAGNMDDFLRRAEEWLRRGYFLAGWLAYECGYLLEPALRDRQWPETDRIIADFGVFQEPVLVDHLDGGAALPAGFAGCPQQPAEQDYGLANLRFSIEKEEYLRAIAAIRSYIAAGDTYQVNYTLKLLFDFSGSPAALYQALRRNQSVGYGAFLSNGGQRILSFSPELFFRKQGNLCTVRPMKGTMPRGRTTAEDRSLRRKLQTDSKNRSENVMIVDLLRNDLGRLATPGSMRVPALFEVETYETLHQMTSTITGELPAGLRLIDLFKALFPCGSVTGAPKIRTMEIIRELEHGPRGVYTGAIGYLAPSGDAVFNVPIRTIVLAGDRGEMGIGSGIVHDSAAEQEWEECRLKAAFLTRPSRDFQLIETLLWQEGKGYWLPEEHLARLADSADYFGFAFDREKAGRELVRLEETFAGESGNRRVRLLLAKDGTMTGSATPCEAPRTLADAPAEPLPQVLLSAARTDARDPFLYHKTTRRDLYDREREKAVRDGYYEVLFANVRGEVTEGAISTLFIRKDGIFYTPPLQCGLLPGIFRAHFLARPPGPVIEKILYPADLAAADAVYVANSVRGMVRVRLPHPPGPGS
jgi:para-aminobenzoate synthetase/4-amino-4-deoxychorismate lyase